MYASAVFSRALISLIRRPLACRAEECERSLQMSRSTPAMWVGALLVSYLAGVWTGVGGAAIAQQSPAPPSSAIPLAPNQGDVVVWAAADLQKAHTELSARSKGRILSKPRDLVQLP